MDGGSDINGSEDDTRDGGSQSEEESEEEELQDQIADIPFEDLQKALSDGRSSFRSSLYSIHKQQPIPKRANKNRPAEMSSKKPVGRFREAIQVPKRIVRDPRFESLCGSYEESRFKNAYSFLYDKELPAERERLQKLLEKDKSSGAAEEVRKHITWIDNQLREEEQRRRKSQKVMEQRSKEKESVTKGKRPFYPKKSEVRKQELVEKYKELKASGKLDAFLAKRRRKNAAKDHRYIPYRRPPAS